MTIGTPTIPEGTPVRITADNLGLVHDLTDPKYDGSVGKGDIGTYVGPHPNQDRLAGWHVISFEVDGETLLCACWPNHFEVIP